MDFPTKEAIKIIYILKCLEIKPSKLIEILRLNNFNTDASLDYFNKGNYRQFKLLPDIRSSDKNFGYKNKQISSLINFLIGEKVKVLEISSILYPELLRQIYFPPPLLFYRGDKVLKSKINIAIVGTRKCSRYGRDAAEYISRELSKTGFTIVSGLALGIDYHAQKAALKEEGGSIGIMGCGIDLCYPEENKDLYLNILDNGSLVTEFFPGTPPLKINFPLRNRIISGLSTGVVVIEAGERSGAIVTSEFALNQNREVFAIPGSIFNSESKGCHKLIKNGAKLVDCIEDILEEICQFFPGNAKFNNLIQTKEKLFKNPEMRDSGNKKILELKSDLDENQKKVVEFLGFNPKTLEEIIANTNLETKKVLNILMELELKGILEEKYTGSYVLL